jgi:hypothetical protein
MCVCGVGKNTRMTDGRGGVTAKRRNENNVVAQSESNYGKRAKARSGEGERRGICEGGDVCAATRVSPRSECSHADFFFSRP